MGGGEWRGSIELKILGGSLAWEPSIIVLFRGIWKKEVSVTFFEKTCSGRLARWSRSRIRMSKKSKIFDFFLFQKCPKSVPTHILSYSVTF